MPVESAQKKWAPAPVTAPAGIPLAPVSVNVLFFDRVTLKEWTYDLNNPYWRIYRMEQPGWSIIYGETEFPLTPSQLAVIPANTSCRSQSRGPAAQTYIHFTLETLLNPFKPGVYFIPLTRNLKQRLNRLETQTDSGTHQALLNTLEAKSLCCDCLCGLPDSSRQSFGYSPRVMAAMETMAGNLKKPWSNDALAKAAGISTNGFIRLFENETGVPPQKWYMERRINRASLMLSHTDRSVETIAEAFGFCDRAHFSRMFARLRGCGPAVYRKRALPQRQNAL